jgi:hypothetical protein
MLGTSGSFENLQALVKALEAGGYNAAPSTLVQGSALQVEDLSPVMHNVTFDDKAIKLQTALKVEPCKSTLAQFDRQLSYGIFGGSAQIEGAVGQEETSDFVRIVVPMAFYSHTRRVTLVANMVDTVDGRKAEERAAADAAKKIAGDIEFDLFRGKADFSNAGVFDGNPLVIPALPNILGLDAQVRMSDTERNAKDQMFGEYGSDDTVVISAGGAVLTQDVIEEAHVRSLMNFGEADKLLIDPKTLASYNKLTYSNKQRIILAGSPQDATGADFRKQWVSGGVVNIEASRFLSGKTKPAPARATGPAVPSFTISSASSATGGSLVAGAYYYYVTACNEIGESPAQAPQGLTTSSPTAGKVELTITNNGAKYYNVYRTVVGAAGTVANCKFIGRVKAASTSTTLFTDLGNMIPGAVTGFLVQHDTMAIKELAPYSRLKLAVTDLSMPEAHFRFCTLAVFQPRKNVIVSDIGA